MTRITASLPTVLSSCKSIPGMVRASNWLVCAILHHGSPKAHFQSVSAAATGRSWVAKNGTVIGAGTLIGCIPPTPSRCSLRLSARGSSIATAAPRSFTPTGIKAMHLSIEGFGWPIYWDRTPSVRSPDADDDHQDDRQQRAELYHPGAVGSRHRGCPDQSRHRR